MEINKFLKSELRLELHPQKSRIISLSKGIDFVGFRNYYYYKLLRKRNIKKIKGKVEFFKKNKLSYERLLEGFNGWYAYAKWADSHNLSVNLIKSIIT